MREAAWIVAFAQGLLALVAVAIPVTIFFTILFAVVVLLVLLMRLLAERSRRRARGMSVGSGVVGASRGAGRRSQIAVWNPLHSRSRSKLHELYGCPGDRLQADPAAPGTAVIPNRALRLAGRWGVAKR